MRDIDVWLCNHEDRTWLVLADHDEAPTVRPGRIRGNDTVGKALTRIRSSDRYNVMQVGILPPDMMGLEEIEVPETE